MGNASSNNEKVIQLLEEQLAYMKQQNTGLSKQIEALTEQVRHLTKLLYGSKTEKSKYNTPDGQASLFEGDSSFGETEHTVEQSQQMISYTVVRSIQKKKRNDSLHDGVEIEVVHHYPEDKVCDCCQGQMIEIGSTIVREEAKIILAKMVKVQHIEHAFGCQDCKGDSSKQAQIKRGKAT
nr:IS66 family transposase zinc-finger binding domain-containing protein [Neobacillus niacini]